MEKLKEKKLILLQQIRTFGDRGDVRVFCSSLPVDISIEGAVYLESFPEDGSSHREKIIIIPSAENSERVTLLEKILKSRDQLGYSAVGIIKESDITADYILSLMDELKIDFPVLLLPSSRERGGRDFDFGQPEAEKQDFPELSGDFREFADIIFGDREIGTVVERLSEILDRDVAYRDLFSKNLHISSRTSEFSENMKLYPLQEILRFFPSCQVRHRERNIGHLVIKPDTGEFINMSLRELGIIGNALIAIRLLAERQMQNADLEKKHRDQLVRDLLYNRVRSGEEVFSRARAFGWKFEGQIVAMIVSPAENSDRESFSPSEKADSPELDLSLVKSRVRMFFPYVAYSHVGNKMVFLLSTAESDDRFKSPDSFYETALLIAHELNIDSTSGVCISAGDFKSDILKVHESYSEAKRALKVLNMYSFDKNVVLWTRLGSYKLLSTLDSDGEAEEFCEKQLSPLIDYDRKNKSDLLSTLYFLEKNNWNLSSTSSVINVHYNTMKYRFKNIADILSLDLDDSENRFNIALALRLYRMRKS